MAQREGFEPSCDFSQTEFESAPLCPVAVPEIFCSLFASQNFDRCHSFLLPSSATGGGRKRPHFDISAYSVVFLLRIPFSSHLRRDDFDVSTTLPAASQFMTPSNLCDFLIIPHFPAFCKYLLRIGMRFREIFASLNRKATVYFVHGGSKLSVFAEV